MEPSKAESRNPIRGSVTEELAALKVPESQKFAAAPLSPPSFLAQHGAVLERATFDGGFPIAMLSEPQFSKAILLPPQVITQLRWIAKRSTQITPIPAGLLPQAHDKSFRLMLSELVANTRMRQGLFPVPPQIQIGDISSSNGFRFLDIEMFQGKLPDQCWRRILSNAELPIKDLTRGWKRLFTGRAELGGRGLASFAECAAGGLPVRLEYSRMEDGGMVTKVLAAILEKPQ